MEGQGDIIHRIIKVLGLLISIQFLCLYLSCSDKSESPTHDILVRVMRSHEEIIYAILIKKNDEVVYENTECGSQNDNLPVEGADCLEYDWTSWFDYQFTAKTGDKIFVFADTEHHEGECGYLTASISIDGKRMVSDEDNEDDCYFLGVTCSWVITD